MPRAWAAARRGRIAAKERRRPLSFTSFAIFFVMCAAAIAVWIDARFPRLCPPDLRSALVRMAAAFVAAQVAVPVVSYLVRPMSASGEAKAVLTVGFVAMTLLMLATVWIVKTLQRLLGGTLR